MEETFGAYIRRKRMGAGISLRSLAVRLEISAVYLSNMENSRRPAPNKPLLDQFMVELHLSKEEQEHLMDLAARSKDQRVSADLPEYIMENDIVRAALRTAREVDATDAEWQEFIDKLNSRTKKSEG